MPKKPIFTKEHIYKTAFELFKKEGLESISARNLAKKLKSSPAPIYSYYATIDDLKIELLDNAKKLFLEYIKQEPTDLIFLNIGFGICSFARDEKELFQTIFLKQSLCKKNKLIREFRDLIREEMTEDHRFDIMDEKEKMDLYLDAWTYGHGLATLIATNYFEEISDEEIRERLLAGAGTIIHKRLEDIQNRKTVEG